MVVFALVIMIYVPCVATITAMIKEIGWKRSIEVTIFEIGLAIIIGDIAFRVLNPFL